MKRALLALSALCLAAPLAHASAELRLFDVDPRTVPPEAMQAVEGVVKGCQYSELSRIGPRPEEVARCNQAMSRALQHGPAAVRAAMVRLERPTNWTGRARLFDVIHRAADADTVAALVEALARVEARPRPEDRDVAFHLKSTLTRMAQLDTQLPDAAAWRAWLATHRGRSPADLLAERIAAERALIRAELAQPSITRAKELLAAAQFLAYRDGGQADARAALEALLDRGGLAPGDQHRAKMLLGRVPAEKPITPEGHKLARVPRS